MNPNQPNQFARRRRPIVQLDRMFDREPPQAPEAEMSLLGSMILDPRGTAGVVAIVKPESFYTEAHTHVFAALVELVKVRNGGDLVMLVDMLRDRGDLSDVGGVDYLESLANAVPVATNWEHYARIVVEKARARALLDIAGRTIYDVYHAGEDHATTDDVVSDCLQDVGQLARGTGKLTTFQQAQDSVIADLRAGRRAVWMTGIPSLDRTIGGVPRQGVLTVMGYPSSGKTSLMLNIMTNLASGIVSEDGREWIQPPLPVRICSYEQPANRIAATIMSSLSKVQVHRALNTGRVPEPLEMVQLEEVRQRTRNVDLAVFEENMDPNTIYAECASLSTKHPHGVVVVDYVQDLPPWGPFLEMNQRVNEGMRILAKIARDIGWLVVAVSQLDKSSARANKRPTMADGLGGSAIEQRSDMMLSVYRPHQRVRRPFVSETTTDLDERLKLDRWKARHGRIDIDCLKTKFGPTGATRLMFDGWTMTYRDPTDSESHWWDVEEEE